MAHIFQDWIVSLFATDGTAAFLENSLAGMEACGIDLACVHVVQPADAGNINNVTQRFGAKTRVLEELISVADLGKLPSSYVEYGSESFNRLMRARFPVIKALRRECDAIVYADIDVAWLANPLPYLGQVLSYYKMAFQTEACPCFPPNFCTGFFALRGGSDDEGLLDTHIARFYSENDRTMQVLFNDIIEKRLEYLRDIFPLPEALFSNGLLHSAIKTRSINSLNLAGHLRPFIFHANFTIGSENKHQLLSHVGEWRTRSELHPVPETPS